MGKSGTLLAVNTRLSYRSGDMVSGISGSAKATIADAKLVTSQISCKELLESYRMRRRAETELLIKADGERNIGILTFYIKDEPVEMVEDAASPSDVLSDGSVRELVATSLSIKSDNEDKDNVITIYNPSALMPGNLLLGRMESLDSEDDTEARFFHQNKASGVWELVAGAPVFKHLQDPFYAGVIQGWHILGGVRIHKVVVDDRVQVDYRTVFYRFKKSINELVDSEGVVVGPFVIGPEGMKDIRLCQLKSGKIALFTRPQGIVGGLGKIAYAEIDSLEDLTEGINKAEIVQELFIDEKEWGGANQVFALSSGLIGVLGHIASKDRLPSGKETIML